MESSHLFNLLDGFTSEQVIMMRESCNEVIMAAQHMGDVIDASCFDDNKIRSVS